MPKGAGGVAQIPQVVVRVDDRQVWFQDIFRRRLRQPLLDRGVFGIGHEWHSKRGTLDHTAASAMLSCRQLGLGPRTTRGGYLTPQNAHDAVDRG